MPKQLLRKAITISIYAPLVFSFFIAEQNLYGRPRERRSNPQDDLAAKFSIKDNNNNPIPGAVLVLPNNKIVVSDEHGMASFECPSGCRFPLMVQVLARGFRSRTQVIHSGAGYPNEIILLKADHPERISRFTVGANELSEDVLDQSKSLQQQALKALDREEYRSAESLLRRALILTPSQWPIYNNIGVSYARRQSLGLAADWFRKGFRIFPHDPILAGNLGQMLWLQGHYEESFPLLRMALRNGYRSPALHYFLGILYLERGNPSEASKNLSRVKDDRLHYRNLFLAVALRQLGKTKDAAKHYDEFLRNNPAPLIASRYVERSH